MKLYIALLLLINTATHAQIPAHYLLKADRVFDGENMHTNWQVLVTGNKVEAVGIITALPTNTKIIELPGTTLMPGMIEGHSHLFLHAYNETSWNDQVLLESRTERTARAINHAKVTLMAGFTTVRDLGTEGAMYDDVALKKTIEKGIVLGPRMIVATRAIVARGTYGPKNDNVDIDLPQGAAEVGGIEELKSEVRLQIGKGADLIKIYADYRWGKDKTTQPTFTTEEMAAAVAIAKSGNRQVVAHAASPEGMRRAILAGISVIEHGDRGTTEIFELMKTNNVALCPTLTAGEATAMYKGWQKSILPEPEGIVEKKKSFALALKAGVTICMGGDVGVFPHGDNAREMERMVDYGMKPLDVLQSATSINASTFGYGNEIGRLKAGLLADIIAVKGDPSQNISVVRQVVLVMKNGVIYKNE
ncbi:MAG: amidohydrolase family protein [Deinococcales bacterium]|nr:amidohydrolase family protein [Chitinophagaceae bacterium]